MNRTITYLTDIFFDPGITQHLPQILPRYNILRPLLVTDPGIISAGLLGSLPIQPAALFTDVHPNPTESNVLSGLHAYRAANCDSVIALGGGSPMDCAKS